MARNCLTCRRGPSVCDLAAKGCEYPNYLMCEIKPLPQVQPLRRADDWPMIEAPEADGWILAPQSDQYKIGDMAVRVKFRNGSESDGRATDFRWGHATRTTAGRPDPAFDIVAWKPLDADEARTADFKPSDHVAPDPAPADVVPCCGEFETCQRPCTPRGAELQRRGLPLFKVEVTPGTEVPVSGLLKSVSVQDLLRDEADPHGLDQHAPGAKLDAGKTMPWLVLGGFSHALAAVVDVGTKGARKYTPNGWASVPDGEARYMEAFGRHMLAAGRGEEIDADTGCLHKAQMIWNLMASLELDLRKANGWARDNRPTTKGNAC